MSEQDKIVEKLTEEMATIMGGKANAQKTVDFAKKFHSEVEKLCTEQLELWQGEIDGIIMLVVQMNALEATAKRMKKVLETSANIDFNISPEKQAEYKEFLERKKKAANS